MPTHHRGHGEGSIYRRADGRWIAELSLGYGADGKEQRWRASGKTRKEVAERLAQAIEQRRRGEAVGTDKQKVGDFLNAWLLGQKPRLAPNTYLSYERKIRLHLKPALGNLPLGKLTPQHVQGVFAAMQAQGLRPRTIAYARAVLRAALTQAQRWGTISRNPAALAEAPKLDESDARSLQPSEARAVIAAIVGDPLEALYLLVLGVGIRQGEALGLLWEDVDLARAEVRISRTLHRVDGKWELRATKTAKSKRVIALPPFLVAALREHWRRQRADEKRAGEHWQTWGLVFTSRRGTPLDRHAVSRRWAKLLVDHEIAHARFYDLRHTCASLLAAEGVSLKEVSEMLGHSTIRLTADTYTHLFAENRRAIADRMERLVRGEEVSS